MDEDHCGEIAFDCFLNWLICRPQRRVRARQITLNTLRPDEDKPLAEIEWTPEVLRQEVQDMLIRTDVSALDVISAYDKTDDGALNKKEFLVFMKAIVGDTELWRESNVKQVTGAVFGAISGDDGELDIEEKLRWISKGWNERKKKLNPQVYAQDEAWTGAEDAEPDNIRVGERLILNNPYFADGTRLRLAPDRESEFAEGAAIDNDEEVEIVAVSPNGFSMIRACENGKTSEGWVRNRNLTRRRRVRGLASVKKSPAAAINPATDAASSPSAPLNRYSSGLAPIKRRVSTSGLSPPAKWDSPQAASPRRSPSLPALSDSAKKSEERSMRHLNYTASRLKEEADDAAQRAARAERFYQKRNVAADYAKTAALAADAERQRVVETRRVFKVGDATRRRYIRERERRDALLNSNAHTLGPSFSMGRLADTGKPSPSMVMVGIPKSGAARPFW